MVDIFEVAPRASGARTPTTPAFAGQEAKMSRYQNLLSKLSSGDDEPADGVYVDWLPQEHEQEAIELGSNGHSKDDDKPLVGTFADAAAAMV